MEKYILKMEDQRLRIEFETMEQKQDLINDMQDNGLDLFTEESGLYCHIKPYMEETNMGEFLSEHDRVGLAFPSEQLKFFFKERIGVKSEHFMDMGPGYDAQMHFNEAFLSVDKGGSITISPMIQSQHAPRCKF